MKVVGLVTEYNPFHKGHLYHIEASKKLTRADYCVVVMSGNFVQRGEPAIVDKWTRAKTALLSGADVVIELPVHYATSSAEFFSSASIALLQNSGIVDSICFGSESGDLNSLEPVAKVLSNEPLQFKALLSNFLCEGVNFPTARAKALSLFLPNLDKTLLSSPNNILGIEYLKALNRLDSNLAPFTIKRLGSGYHDQNPEAPIASATAIRKYLKEGDAHLQHNLENLLPINSSSLLLQAIHQNIAPIFSNDLLPFLRYKLLTMPKEELHNILDVTEGLENRILSTIEKADSMEALLDILATKRYTRTKISRALLHILLDIDKQSFKIFNHNGYAQYLRVLGFKQEAQLLMRQMKHNASIPMIVNVKDSIKSLTSLQTKMITDEMRATHLFNTLVFSKYGTQMKNDYTQPILVV